MLADLIYRLRALFHRRDMEADLEEELRFHLERETEKYAERGASAEEAARAARLALQGVEQTKERCRDARGIAFWDATLQDVRYAGRQLRSARGFAAATVAVLALGIGANTAIFSLLNAVMLRSLPVRDPQQLLVPAWEARGTPHPFNMGEFEACFEQREGGRDAHCSFSYPVFRAIEADREIFSHATAFAGPMRLNMEARGSASLVDALVVSGDFFQTLGVRAAVGRLFVESDDTPQAAGAIVLGYGYWQRVFGGDASVVGKTIRLNAAPFTVIGVADAAFNRWSPGRSFDLWLPIHSTGKTGNSWGPSGLDDQHSFWLKIVGRLQAGVSPKQAQSKLTALVRNTMISEAKILDAHSELRVEVASADQALTGIRDMLAKPLSILMCGVGLILLIACANVATLMTARGVARRREIGIRMAIGAGRGRIVRQLLTESILLALAGGLAGCAVAWFGTRWLLRLDQLANLDANPDAHVLLFTLAISVGAAIVFGSVPALESARDSGLLAAISVAHRRRWFSNGLVAAQVSLAAVYWWVRACWRARSVI